MKDAGLLSILKEKCDDSSQKVLFDVDHFSFHFSLFLFFSRNVISNADSTAGKKLILLLLSESASIFSVSLSSVVFVAQTLTGREKMILREKRQRRR